MLELGSLNVSHLHGCLSDFLFRHLLGRVRVCGLGVRGIIHYRIRSLKLSHMNFVMCELLDVCCFLGIEASMRCWLYMRLEREQ